MTRKDVKGDQPSGGETTWTNTGATRYGRGQHKTGSFGDDMLRPSPNHGTQRLPMMMMMMKKKKIIRIMVSNTTPISIRTSVSQKVSTYMPMCFIVTI